MYFSEFSILKTLMTKVFLSNVMIMMMCFKIDIASTLPFCFSKIFSFLIHIFIFVTIVIWPQVRFAFVRKSHCIRTVCWYHSWHAINNSYWIIFSKFWKKRKKKMFNSKRFQKCLCCSLSRKVITKKILI